jgi:hypothetical protein
MSRLARCLPSLSEGEVGRHQYCNIVIHALVMTAVVRVAHRVAAGGLGRGRNDMT